MPGDVLQERIQEDSVPYDIWVQKGYITLTEGSQNGFSLVTQWFRSMIDDYDIRPLWVGYDPWNSQYWVKEMDDMGFEMEKIRQGVYTLSEPMKQLEADIRNHALNYDSNPIVKWGLANTQAKVDVNGNIQPSKLNSRLKRIDGAVPRSSPTRLCKDTSWITKRWQNSGKRSCRKPVKSFPRFSL